MDTIKKCTGHNCWDCRVNIDAFLKIEDCGKRFLRMYNISIVRRLYEEKQYYFPCFFRWEDPYSIIWNIKKCIGHRIILLDRAGNFRPGVVIKPNSAPTNYQVFGKNNIWIRWSLNLEMVLVYPRSSTVAVIDLETYSDKRTHPYRVSYQDGKYELESDLPF